MAQAKKAVSRLTRKGQTTIPSQIRRLKGLAPGDRIVWILNKDGSIDLMKVFDDQELDRFVGIVKELGRDTDAIMGELRGPRN